MPELYVIAGPNGSGKTTFSADLVPPGIAIFDGDKELLQLQQKFTGTDPSRLMEYINEEYFPEKKEAAIRSRTDFAFETNFATSDVMQTAKLFKSAGYETNLIYIGLASVQDALQRVDLRVRKGGHFVTAENIRTNYEAGIHNLQAHIRDFDRSLIYDDTGKSKQSLLRILYKIQNGILREKAPNIPQWARSSFQDELLPKKRISHSKGKKL